MTSETALQTNAPLVACTISRDVQNFDLLIEDMEDALGEAGVIFRSRTHANFSVNPTAAASNLWLWPSIRRTKARWP